MNEHTAPSQTNHISGYCNNAEMWLWIHENQPETGAGREG